MCASHAMVYVEVRGQLLGVGFFHFVNLGDPTLSARFGGKRHNLLSYHPAGPSLGFCGVFVCLVLGIKFNSPSVRAR